MKEVIKKKEELIVLFDDTAVAFGSKTDRELAFSIFIFRIMGSPMLVKIGTALSLFALRLRLPVKGLIKATIFKQFCGGVSIDDCDRTINKLHSNKIGAILDYSVEGQASEKVFDHTANELINIIKKGANNPAIPFSCMKITGVGRFELLAKAQRDEELNVSERQEYAMLVQRLDGICSAAAKFDTPIYIDAEETWIQDTIDRLAETMMRKYNQKKAVVFTTLQMYRHDRLTYLKKLLDQARREGFVLGVKFVRGAYMEKERARAAELGYPDPIQPNKEASDDDYDAGIKLALDHLENIEITAGTHNEYSCMLLAKLMADKRIPNNHPSVYFSQLYGMSDHISYNLAHAGYNVSKYLPYGPVRDTMPYLIRRARENTSVAGQVGRELVLLLSERARRKMMH